MSKILLHTSGRVLSGAVTVVFGGATLIYDIYRLNEEVQTLAGRGKDGAADIRSSFNFFHLCYSLSIEHVRLNIGMTV